MPRSANCCAALSFSAAVANADKNPVSRETESIIDLHSSTYPYHPFIISTFNFTHFPKLPFHYYDLFDRKVTFSSTGESFLAKLKSLQYFPNY